MADTMRTRFMQRMTNEEVENYLERNDIIFVAVGACETHGDLPLNCEQIVPEAFALKMAEAVDGLVLGDLPYFYVGGTTVGRGTVQMSINDGYHYIKQIAHSLLNQGFRRQVYLTLHGPAYLTLGALARDFFDETKDPILYIDLVQAFGVAGVDLMKGGGMDMFYGAYGIVDKVNELPIIDEAKAKYTLEEIKKLSGSPIGKYTAKLGRLATYSGAVGSYFSKPMDHAGFSRLTSEKERDERIANGAQIICDIVDKLDMPGVVDAMRHIDDFTQSDILPKYPHLPRNKE